MRKVRRLPILTPTHLSAHHPVLFLGYNLQFSVYLFTVCPMPPKKKTTTSRALATASVLPALPSPRRRGATGFPPTVPEPNPCTPENSDGEDSTRRLPPVIFSPVKARQRKKSEKLKDLTDAKAWKYEDDEILGRFTV